VSVLQGYKKRTVFVVGNRLLPKLTGVETLLPVSILFQLMRTQTCVLWTENTAIAFHIPTHKHILYIYIHIVWDLVTGILEEMIVSAMWICR